MKELQKDEGLNKCVYLFDLGKKEYIDRVTWNVEAVEYLIAASKHTAGPKCGYREYMWAEFYKDNRTFTDFIEFIGFRENPII